MTNRNQYDAFGELSTTNLNNIPSANAIGYTGQRLDTETGLMALGNGERYYSPNYARFIQQDSWLGDNTMPQSLNRFAYAHNNPFAYTDPSGNTADDNRGSFANSAREYGLNKNGENNWWNITKNWAARSGYDLWNTISLGTLSRQEETVAQVEKGEITQAQFEKQTGNNAALGFAKVGLMILTAGAGNALMAGAGLATRIGIGAGLGVAEQFGNDALEMMAGFRNDFSSAGTYALSAFTGGLFGAASPGKAATAYAKESKMTLGTELKFLRTEAKELGQSIGQRLNPRNYNYNFNDKVFGSNGGGFEIEFKSSKQSPKSGETSATKSGKQVHKELAAERRLSDDWDNVNEPIKNSLGENIEVPKRVDLKTNKPVTRKGN